MRWLKWHDKRVLCLKANEVNYVVLLTIKDITHKTRNAI
jgi:hypothetical protein